jgi:two-component system cell cycle sensor histidine kinase/response regulator CckA
VSSPRQGRRRPLVILVDDEPLVRRYVEKMLRSIGFHVVSFGDGWSALTCLTKHEGSVSLVVSDVMMPGMGGIELAREIARRWGDLVPVLLISGDPAIAEPKGPFLQKPFRSDQLYEAIGRLLSV